jgi:ribosomal protein L11 methyltransferase
MSKYYLWSRRIASAQEEAWHARLAAAGVSQVVYREKPGATHGYLELYAASPKKPRKMSAQFGGKVKTLQSRQNWYGGKKDQCIRVKRGLEVTNAVHRYGNKHIQQLYIPAGRAFGSGQHPTTRMILKALGRQKAWSRQALLDIGTGSGILALTARALGAARVTGIDVDPESIRTAKENERRNFGKCTITWRCHNLAQYKTMRKYDVITANLFSELLVANARAICSMLHLGGSLYLSGILRGQERSVVKAFRKFFPSKPVIKRAGKWMAIFYNI